MSDFLKERERDLLPLLSLTETKGLLMRLKITKGEVTPLKSNIACSINISCTHEDEDGHMHVEMNYEGDACLAAYLLEGAQQIISEKIEEEEVSYPSSTCI